MNMVEGKIVHLLTGKNSLNEVSVNDLRAVADRQPYFSVAQLLLAKKMKQENHPEYLQQVQKTALYFPNVHWLHYQLNNEFEGESAVEAKASQSTDNIAVVEEEQQEQLAEIADETITEENVQEVQSIETSPVDREIFVPSQEETSSNDDGESVEEIKLPQNDQEIEEDDEEDAPVPADAGSSRLSSIIEEQLKEFNKEVNTNSKLPIEPEPFHTIDYFASQGIRLTPMQLQQDQLGNRVRKFTDWLKQMKRVQNDPQDLGTDPQLEHMVEHIAATSNESKEIVTEAMAEVLVKQGKAEKAVQLYIKLSFLNPDKSAYFAAKIQELKGI